MDVAQLLWIVLFSSIGLGFFVYGRKAVEDRADELRPGPDRPSLFPSSKALLVAVGVLLTAIPNSIRM